MKKKFLVVFSKFKTETLLTFIIFHNMKKTPISIIRVYKKKYTVFITYKYFCVAEFIFKNKKNRIFMQKLLSKRSYVRFETQGMRALTLNLFHHTIF